MISYCLDPVVVVVVEVYWGQETDARWCRCAQGLLVFVCQLNGCRDSVTGVLKG